MQGATKMYTHFKKGKKKNLKRTEKFKVHHDIFRAR